MKKLVIAAFTAATLVALTACSSTNQTNGNAMDYNTNGPRSMVAFPDSSASPAQVPTVDNPAGAGNGPASTAAPGSPAPPE